MKERSKLNVTVFRRLLSYWKNYKGLFFFAVICTLFLAVLAPIRPMLVGHMVDAFIMQGQDAKALLDWTLVIILILLGNGIFQFLQTYYANLFAQSIIRDIRQELMKHVVSFRVQFFDRTPIGTLVTRLISDLEAITDVFSSGMMNIAGDLLMLVVVIVMMFVTNWQLSIMVLVPIPLLIIATRVFARIVRKTFQQEREQVNRLNNFVQERLTGMSLVQLFNRQKEEYDRFKEINKKHRQAHINAVWAYSIFFPVVEILSSLSIGLMLVWAAIWVVGYDADQIGQMYGEIFAFILWVQMLYRPIRQLAEKFNILQRGTVRAERVFELLDRKVNIQSTGTKRDCNFDRRIQFKNVYFAYNDEDWVLKNINLDIAPGETIAFVGATGAGKLKF